MGDIFPSGSVATYEGDANTCICWIGNTVSPVGTRLPARGHTHRPNMADNALSRTPAMSHLAPDFDRQSVHYV